MMTSGNITITEQRVPLIIPVESQVRELDAKLLLACVAARRGYPVVIGRLKALDASIRSFPRSVYLAKSFWPKNFQILRGLGHEITVWEEEALVHLPPEMHFIKRMPKDSCRYVSQLFAWGRDNADLWRSNRHYSGTPIHITGNPRSDLLRPEIRSYFDTETQEYSRIYGDFFLINTNFSMVNSNRALFLPVANGDGDRMVNPMFTNLPRAFVEQLDYHKRDIFERFLHMIPELAHAFPDINIVIRPHPSENPLVYHRIAAACERVTVLIEGNVIPWLLAAKATVHNGCTTAIEANLLGVPTVSYGPTEGDGRDFGRAWRLPDLLSHAAEDFTALRKKLELIVSGELGCFVGVKREKAMSEFLTSQEGPLACERIVNVLDEWLLARRELPPPSARIAGLARALNVRWYARAAKAFARKPRKTQETKRAAHHDLSLEQLRERLDRFQSLLGDPVDLSTEKLAKYIYRIRA